MSKEEFLQNAIEFGKEEHTPEEWKEKYIELSNAAIEFLAIGGILEERVIQRFGKDNYIHMMNQADEMYQLSEGMINLDDIELSEEELKDYGEIFGVDLS